MPNNRLRWHDPASVTPYETPPEYVTNTHVWQVEGRRRGTTGGYFYTDVPASAAALRTPRTKGR